MTAGREGARPGLLGEGPGGNVETATVTAAVALSLALVSGLATARLVLSRDVELAVLAGLVTAVALWAGVLAVVTIRRVRRHVREAPSGARSPGEPEDGAAERYRPSTGALRVTRAVEATHSRPEPVPRERSGGAPPPARGTDPATAPVPAAAVSAQAGGMRGPSDYRTVPMPVASKGIGAERPPESWPSPEPAGPGTRGVGREPEPTGSDADEAGVPCEAAGGPASAPRSLQPRPAARVGAVADGGLPVGGRGAGRAVRSPRPVPGAVGGSRSRRPSRRIAGDPDRRR